MGLFDRFFREEEDTAPDVMEASQVMAWASAPYHAKFMKWIEDEIDRPVPIDAQMMANTMRSNTFKEIRLHIRTIIGRARLTEAETQEDVGV